MSDDPKSQLQRHGLFPKHSFGQNFLADRRVCDRIAELAVPESGGTVIEIGAGLGALTRPLLTRATKVIAIERDRDMAAALRLELTAELETGQLTLEEADAKQVDYATLASHGPEPRVLAGNLPYQITGPLLELAVRHAGQFVRCVFLVQLEVADRMAASAGSADYGGLTVFLQNRFQVRRALVVKKGAFYPQPRVDSAVVELVPLAEPLAEEDSLYRALVHGAFAQRRKKLRNAWQSVTSGDPQRLQGAAQAAGIDLDARGETLSPGQFAAMRRALTQVAQP